VAQVYVDLFLAGNVIVCSFHGYVYGISLVGAGYSEVTLLYNDGIVSSLKFIRLDIVSILKELVTLLLVNCTSKTIYMQGVVEL